MQLSTSNILILILMFFVKYSFVLPPMHDNGDYDDMYEHYLKFIVIVFIRRRLETTIAILFPYREGVLFGIGQPMLQGVPKNVLI